MRTLSLVGVVLAFIVTHPVSSAGQKPAKLTPVPLNVTIHAEPAAGVSCGICGDYGGDTVYRHGEDSVDAMIDGFGNFILNFQTGNRALHYVYRPLGSEESQAVAIGFGFRHYLSTIQLPAELRYPGYSFEPFQSMAVDDVQHVASCPSYVDDAGLSYRHAFARNCGGDMSGTSMVRVTKTLDGWTLETDGTDAAARVFHLSARGKTVYVDDGLYSLPFKMTLTPQ